MEANQHSGPANPCLFVVVLIYQSEHLLEPKSLSMDALHSTFENLASSISDSAYIFDSPVCFLISGWCGRHRQMWHTWEAQVHRCEAGVGHRTGSGASLPFSDH